VDPLVQAAQDGDFQAAERLLARYLPLIRQKVLCYGRLADYQDLLQQGRLIFLEILREYDNGRGVPFGAYLKEKFRWRLFHYIRDVLGYRDREDLFSDVPVNTIQDILTSQAGGEPDKADWEALAGAVKTLTPKQRLVLSLFYWDELSVREIAGKLHETPQGVRQLKARAEKHLRLTLAPSPSSSPAESKYKYPDSRGSRARTAVNGRESQPYAVARWARHRVAGAEGSDRGARRALWNGYGPARFVKKLSGMFPSEGVRGLYNHDPRNERG